MLSDLCDSHYLFSLDQNRGFADVVGMGEIYQQQKMDNDEMIVGVLPDFMGDVDLRHHHQQPGMTNAKNYMLCWVCKQC